MATINLNNSSEVVVLGTIDAGNDGQQILLTLIKNFDPRNYQTGDFVFSAPVALTGQDTVVDVIAATADAPATAVVRNTRIFLTPKASTGLYGPKIIYYDRIHATDLPDTTVTKGVSATVFEILSKLNVKTGLGIKEEDVVDGPLPAADVGGMVTVPLVFKSTSLVFYGTTKINAIDYQFGGNATYVTVGTVFGQYCYGTNLMRVVADGAGGANVVLFEANSSVCPLPTAGADGLNGIDGQDGVNGAAGLQGPSGTTQLPPIACSDEMTPLTAGENIVTFHWSIDQPFVKIWAGLTTPQTSGVPVMIDVVVDGVSILDVPITIENGDETSLTSLSPEVLGRNRITVGARVAIDILQVGDGTATGLKVYWNVEAGATGGGAGAPECLLLTLADPNEGITTMDQRVRQFNVTTVLSSKDAAWDTDVGKLNIYTQGVYRITLNCRARCLVSTGSGAQWPAGMGFILGSAISPAPRILPTFLNKSAHARAAIIDGDIPFDYEQWTDEYMFNWDGAGTGVITPEIYSRSTDPLLTSGTIITYDMAMSVVRLGTAIPAPPQV